MPGHAHSPFAWLESIAPPILVLSTAYVLKEQVLEIIEQRHADGRAFQLALAEWQAATAVPEQHIHWTQFYANALRDALLKTNARRQEVLNNMSIEAWRLVVTREIQAELWYAVSDNNHDKLTSIPEVVDAPDRRNGHSVLPKVGAAIESGTV